MRLFVTFLLLFLCVQNVIAGYQPNLLTYKRISKKNGLPNNYIFSISQSADGFLWIGSQGGLTRFDGKSLLTFNEKNTSAISVSDVTFAFEKELGVLWVATRNEIVEYNRGKFKKLLQIEDKVNFIKKDRYDNIVIGSYSEFYVYKNGKFKNLSSLLKRKLYLYNFYSSNDLEDIFLSTSKGLYVVDKNYNLKNVIEPSVYFFEIVKWNNFFLACTDNGFYQVTKDGAGWIAEKLNSLPNIGIFDLALDKNNNLYGISINKIVKISKKSLTNVKIEYISLPKGLKPELNDIFFDREGSLWIASKKGLIQYRETTFRAYVDFWGKEVSSFYKDTNSERCLIATYGEGLYYFNGNSIKKISNELYFYCVFVSKKGDLFASSKKHLYLISKNGNVKEIFGSNNKPLKRVFSIVETKDGKIWFQQEKSLAYYKNGKVTCLNKDFLWKDGVRSIVEDNNGGLWVGGGDGLFYIKGNNVQVIKDKGKFLPYIFNLYLDNDSVLWIGTDEGLYRYKDNKFGKITFKEGLSSNWIVSIIEDNKGYLWLGASGVQRIKKTFLNQYFDKKLDKLDFLLFTKEDGLPIDSIAGGIQYCTFKEANNIWYCTNNGLAVVDTDNLVINSLKLKPIVESILIDGAKKNNFDNIALEPNTKRIEFIYTAPTFIKNDLIKFKIKLKGYDDYWKVTKDRKVSFTNLSPGNYSFQVLACNSAGIWNDKPTSVNFTVIRPFYMTWWFYTLCAIFGVIAGNYIYKGIAYLIHSAIFLKKSKFVGPYKIVETVGVGGMGTVYKAISLETKKTVALKVLNESITDDDMKKRFIREGLICEKISHPNVVKIYSRGEDRGRLYYAMEYCNGKSLRKVLNEGRLPLLKSLWVVSVLFDVLHDIHSEGVVHRDVKPENIMLTGSFDLSNSKIDNRLLPNLKNSLKLLDFGLAKTVGNTALTKTGLLAGTIYYLPPECIQQKLEWYPEADFYAVGVLLYEMITGLRPFEGEDMMEVMYRILQHVPEPPIAVDNTIPKDLSDFVVFLLSKNRDERLVKYSEIKIRLDKIIENTVKNL